MIKLLMIIIFFVGYCFSIAQVEFDSCNCEAKRILDTYKRLESKYREIAMKKVLYYISEDEILRNHFLINDSSNFKKLTLYINPILKISENANEFTFKENICKYFVFDTVNYECAAGFYLKDSLQLFLTRGHNDCDYWVMPICGSDLHWCPGEDTFVQHIYIDSLINCTTHHFFSLILVPHLLFI